MAEVTLIDVKIPTGAITSAKSEIAALRSELVRAREDQKMMNKANQQGTDAYTQNAITIKQLSSEIRVNERVLIANEKAQKANTGSIEQMSQQLSVASSAWAKMSKEERENTEQGKKLTKQKTDLTKELKILEAQTGDNRRNVGNYSESMKEALQTSGLFAREQRVLGQAQKLYAVATGGASKATNIFKIALASTGIGAIVILLGSLVAYLTTTQEGMDKLTAVTKPLQAIFQRLMGAIQDLGKLGFDRLAEAISNPKQALSDFIEFIKTNALNRLKAFGVVTSGIIKLLKGDFTGGIKSVTDGVLQFATGVEDVTGKLGKAGTAVADFIEKGIEAGTELDQLQKQLEKTEVNLARKRAELNTVFEKSKEIAEDQTKSENERRKAAEAAIAAQNTLLQQEQDYLDQKIALKEKEQSLNDTDRVGEKELQDLYAERVKLEGEAAAKRTSVNNLLNTLKKQSADAEKKNIAEIEAAKIAASEAELERAQMAAAQKVAALEMNYEEELNILKEYLLNGQLTREEYDLTLYEMELQALEDRKQLLIENGESTIEIEGEILDRRIAQRQKLEKATIALGKTEQGIEKETFKNSQTIANAAAASLNKKSAAGKAAASAATILNTYSSATAALAPPPTGLGPVAGIPVAAFAIITGITNLAKINAVQIPKFAGGVIGLDGAGTGTSDSISANLSRGESVMTAKATSVFAPEFAAMERAVGNTPNWQLGNRNFASGIISAGSSAAISTARNDLASIENQASAFSNVQIVTKISDIERVQTQEAQAESIATVTSD